MRILLAWELTCNVEGEQEWSEGRRFHFRFRWDAKRSPALTPFVICLVNAATSSKMHSGPHGPLHTLVNESRWQATLRTAKVFVRCGSCNSEFPEQIRFQSLTSEPPLQLLRVTSEARMAQQRGPIRMAGICLFWMRRRIVRGEHPKILAAIWTRRNRSSVLWFFQIIGNSSK